jgi:hypothetical protein
VAVRLRTDAGTAASSTKDRKEAHSVDCTSPGTGGRLLAYRTKKVGAYLDEWLAGHQTERAADHLRQPSVMSSVCDHTL